ncbi:MAG TPA: hypothetical protein VFT64_05410 [Rickettsiales bacterium]|nr:hypothetical protein [Rickettsiales bacterium]
MTTVAGIFDSRIEAERAFSLLLEQDFRKEDISLLISDKARHTIFPPPVNDEGERATRGGAAGALFGGSIGALVAGLTAVGNIVVPGMGLLASGPLTAILAGLGTGAVAGGLSGALISAGFAVDDAKKYENEVKRGKVVLIVHTTDERKDAARTIMQTSNATTKVA